MVGNWKDIPPPPGDEGALKDHLNQIERAQGGGAAFGMSMRDYFAAKALSTVPAYSQEDVTNWSAEDFAKHAYALADAMLAERAK